MNVTHVTGTINHLVIEDMAVAMREAGMSCGLVSSRPEPLLGRTFLQGSHLVLPELGAAEFPGDASVGRRALQNALESLQPDVVVLHDISLARLLPRPAAFRTALVVHTLLCAGAKLFRRANQVCQHPIGYRCLLDWYRGPCGTAPDPRVAFRQMRAATSHQEALGVPDEIWVLSRFMARYLSGENSDAAAIRILDPRFVLSPLSSAASVSVAPPASERSGIVFTGRWTYAKGLLPLLDAMAHVPEIELCIVGDGYLREEVTQRAAQLPNVSLVPFLDREDLPAIYGRARALVCPSLWPEPLGMVPFEALQCGTPAIVSNRGGLPEWQEFFDHGVVVLEDVSAPLLARAMRQVNEHPPPVVASNCLSTDRVSVARAVQDLCR